MHHAVNTGHSSESEMVELHRQLIKAQSEISDLKAQVASLENRPPVELIDLTRFLANVWNDINSFVYRNCDRETLVRYPGIQGSANQFSLIRISEQQYAAKNLSPAVKWLLSKERYDLE